MIFFTEFSSEIYLIGPFIHHYFLHYCITWHLEWLLSTTVLMCCSFSSSVRWEIYWTLGIHLPSPEEALGLMDWWEWSRDSLPAHKRKGFDSLFTLHLAYWNEKRVFWSGWSQLSKDSPSGKMPGSGYRQAQGILIVSFFYPLWVFRLIHSFRSFPSWKSNLRVCPHVPDNGKSECIVRATPPDTLSPFT